MFMRKKTLGQFLSLVLVKFECKLFKRPIRDFQGFSEYSEQDLWIYIQGISFAHSAYYIENSEFRSILGHNGHNAFLGIQSQFWVIAIRRNAIYAEFELYAQAFSRFMICCLP